MYRLFIVFVVVNCTLSQKIANRMCEEFVNQRLDSPVLGRNRTSENEFPHMVALGFGNQRQPSWLCAGTLISNQFVLTSAHCTSLPNVGPVRVVRVGTNVLNPRREQDYSDLTISRVVVHPYYETPSSYNDIALLKLQRKVQFSRNTLPACLNSAFNVNLATNTLLAVGWGRMEYNGSASNDLRQDRLRIVRNRECNRSYRVGASRDKIPEGVDDETQICVGREIQPDTCLGLSEGPLEYKNGRFHYIIGVTSFGTACGVSRTPGASGDADSKERTIYQNSTRSKIIFLIPGTTSGELSKQMCKKYLEYVPASYKCPFSESEPPLGNSFAAKEELPYMVALGYDSDDSIGWHCSAVLISEDFVLTSSHCLQGSHRTPPVVARVGINDLDSTEGLQEIKVKRVYKHPDYNYPRRYNGIGLVQLEKKVDITPTVRPACLFTEKEITANRVINSGWGPTSYHGEFDKNLQKVILEVFDEGRCNEVYNKSLQALNKGITYDTMICVGAKSVESIQPRTGGPLLIPHKDEGGSRCIHDVIGVASFGKSINVLNIPDVYTRVSAFIPWIESVVWKN
ncbi:hypothetical protein NQ315_008527 [Exocentrus adspersus]|uniref:Peptidase S1 domain-containing protein n=1 Tax=Exocentrus adspersus TaxID=1586481 RepID=A0AAV8W5Z9_9CUCU|nr:hypothetical protein NQ315_008527 [Exocentrus adspersus]